MKKIKLHLLPNAHLDPVWLWDWREGATEAVSTCRCMVELMHRNPELTFLRGEAWVYQQIERYAPDLIAEIKALIAAKRWDIVGGNYVQSDTNLPDTATFVRQFEVGMKYFKEHFNTEVTACWSADSFGQSHGLVEIFAQAGIRYYAFSRPEAWYYALPKPLFFWRGQGGSELLSYRIPIDWYASERTNIGKRLDLYLEQSRTWDLENVAVYFGLGDHGGGPSQRNIDEINRWSLVHPEVEVVFSTMHGFFHEAEAEIARRGRDLVQTIDHEMNFLQRGYYASCLKTKAAYRNAEAALKRASVLDTLIAHTVKAPAQDMSKEWHGLLFNTFHDILPGTSIERASVEQVDWMRGISHDALRLEFEACNRLAARLDTTVPKAEEDMPEAVPVVVFNPHPFPYRGPVEIETCLDYRPIWDFQNRPAELPVELLDEAGKPVAFQKVAYEHCSFLSIPWRQRVLFDTEIPAGGWRQFSIGYVRNPQLAPLPADAPARAADESLSNGLLRLEIDRKEQAIKIYRGDRELFGGAGLALECCRDTWGSWGCQKEKPEGFMCRDTIERWQIGRCKVLEDGPLRAVLFVEFIGAHSTATAKISVRHDQAAVELAFRIVWSETGTRLRIVTERADSVNYAVTGGEALRTVAGDVPGGRYLQWHKEGRTIGLVADKLCCFGNYDDVFAVTLIRGSRYATEVEYTPDELIENPACDLGEHTCKLTVVLDEAQTLKLAREMEMPPVVMMCDRHPGVLPGVGSMLELDNPAVRLIDLQPAADGHMTATLQQLATPEEVVTLTTSAGTRTVTVPFARIIKVEL